MKRLFIAAILALVSLVMLTQSAFADPGATNSKSTSTRLNSLRSKHDHLNGEKALFTKGRVEKLSLPAFYSNFCSTFEPASAFNYTKSAP